MRTTLDLDEMLMAELMKATQAKSKTEAIHLAMTDLIRRKKSSGSRLLVEPSP